MGAMDIVSRPVGADGVPKMSPSHRLVFDVIIGRHRAGWPDVCDEELQQALERLHQPRRFDRNWISGRVAEMKARGLLLESPGHRLPRDARDGAARVRACYVPVGYRTAHAAVVAEGCY